jgi:hypothetical protein
MQSYDDCVAVFESDAAHAEDSGCSKQSEHMLECWYRVGFRCERGVLLWNSGCSDVYLELDECLAEGEGRP